MRHAGRNDDNVANPNIHLDAPSHPRAFTAQD